MPSLCAILAGCAGVETQNSSAGSGQDSNDPQVQAALAEAVPTSIPLTTPFTAAPATGETIY